MRRTHPWLDDGEQVPSGHELLGESVVLIGLEGDSKQSHNAGVARQMQGDAVFSQEALELGRGLGQHFESHWSPCDTISSEKNKIRGHSAFIKGALET